MVSPSTRDLLLELSDVLANSLGSTSTKRPRVDVDEQEEAVHGNNY